MVAVHRTPVLNKGGGLTICRHPVPGYRSRGGGVEDQGSSLPPGDLDGLQAIMRNTKVLLNRKGVPNLLGLDQLKANGLGSFAKEVGAGPPLRGPGGPAQHLATTENL